MGTQCLLLMPLVPWQPCMALPVAEKFYDRDCQSQDILSSLQEIYRVSQRYLFPALDIAYGLAVKVDWVLCRHQKGRTERRLRRLPGGGGLALGDSRRDVEWKT